MQKEKTKQKIFKINVLIWKKRFEIGYGLTSLPKWIVAVFGVGEVVNKNYTVVLVGACIFTALCVIVGWAWMKYGWYEAEIEIGNMYNLFVKEMRKKLKKRKSI